jgi:hypothetical protein
MQRVLRVSTIYAVMTLLAVSSFGQDRPGWRTASDIGESARGAIAGTVVDVDEGRNRLQIEADEDDSRVTVETDSLTTQFNGFGGMIAGKPEIFIGSRGFSNVRVGDRVDVRGTGRGRGTVMADTITLLGRSVTAPQVGVGETRSPSAGASTQVDDRVTGTTTATSTGVEGTVRQVNAEQGRIVIQTAQRQMITIRASRTTPVWYRGEQFRIANLDVGDRIRITADRRGADTGEITAQRIDVVASVQDAPGSTGTGGTVALLSGRITRIEQGLDYAYLDTGRSTEIRVDMSSANDAVGDRIRAADLRVNDRVEISGSYNRTGDMFVASTVRYGSGDTDTRAPAPTPRPADEFVRFGVVTITGTVTETLEDAATLGIRDRDTNRIVRVWVTEGFTIRLKSNTAYAAAETLKVNDSVVLKAYQDANGNLIAQEIRVRTR